MPFRKKRTDDELDSQKASLFGGRSKSSNSAPPSTANPYAVPPPSNDPYARQSANPYAQQNGLHDPYARQSHSNISAPPTGSFGSLSLNNEQGGPPSYNRQSPAPNRYEKSPVPPGGYGGGAPRYQAQGSYGQAGGYGSDPYRSEPSGSRPGGYGGLGRSDSQDTVDPEVRRKLFDKAPERAQQQQAHAAQQSQDPSYTNSGGYDSSEMPGGYGAGADRELTGEEEEEQEVDAAKGEIRFIKQQDVASTRNARLLAETSEQIGRDTLARLGQQGERIHNTERNLDLASHQNRIATEKARELKSLNRSMFAVHMPALGNRSKKEEEMLQRDLEQHQREKEIKSMTTKEAYDSKARQQGAERGLSKQQLAARQKQLADRTKYQFEADSEDDEMEDEIEENLEIISRSVNTLHRVGKAMGDEIAAQNKHLDRISGKTDKIDDELFTNVDRLDRILKKG